MTLGAHYMYLAGSPWPVEDLVAAVPMWCRRLPLLRDAVALPPFVLQPLPFVAFGRYPLRYRCRCAWGSLGGKGLLPRLKEAALREGVAGLIALVWRSDAPF